MSDIRDKLNEFLKKIRENPYALADLGFYDINQLKELRDNLVNALEVAEKIIGDHYTELVDKKRGN